jgi:ubiquinone/menaquinone biosynthesis C-methylase UbiE
LSKELVSYFPKGNGEGFALDLGCGTALHKELCLQCGFKYIGLDYDSKQASMLGDAHALPFKDNSIDFILSIAVLEHIQHPNIMLSEAYRVLKPGGKLIGTVSFLEPFHGISFYHHTHLGVFNSLNVAGFKTSNISPTSDWGALRALSTMAFFPGMPQMISRIIYSPVQLLHRLWWKLGHLLKKSEASSEKKRVLSTSGAFSFIAKKEF